MMIFQVIVEPGVAPVTYAPMATTEHRTAYRTCPLCEATCGLELTLDGDTVAAIRGDAADVFSQGFICPKGAALKQLHEDPDRVRTPLIKDGDGFRPASWDEAFAVIHQRLSPILDADRNAVAVYLGNPNAHNLDSLLYGRVLLKALSTRNVYSASTVDQIPKQLAAALMFGTGTTVPVPDVDRTDHLLMLGANPLASNGSLMTAPDMRGRLRALRARGGKLVVIDPRRTRTAEEADEHHFIRPGTDALLLFALVHVLFEEDLADPGEKLDGPQRRDRRGPSAGRAVHSGRPSRPPAGSRRPRSAAWPASWPPRRRPRCTAGSAPAPRSSGRWRAGWSTSSTSSPAISTARAARCSRSAPPDTPTAPGQPGRGRGARFGRFASRVRGLGEIFGELPVVCLAEEIDTPGEGRVRALVTLAGNPVVSTPNSDRLERRAGHAGFHGQPSTSTSTRPPATPTSSCPRHRPCAAATTTWRSTCSPSATWPTTRRRRSSPIPTCPTSGSRCCDSPASPPGWVPTPTWRRSTSGVARLAIAREIDTPGSPVAGRTPDEVLAALEPRVGPERLLDLMLRAGPYGDGVRRPSRWRPEPRGAGGGPARDRPRAAPAAPPGRAADRERHDRAGPRAARGRRARGCATRSAARGPTAWCSSAAAICAPTTRGCTTCRCSCRGPRSARCTSTPTTPSARAHRRRAGACCARARAASTAEVEVTDAVMPGVVSLPHGWGHDAPGRA